MALHEGLQIALEDGADWVWMMDDDAAPHVDALERLLAIQPDPENIYSSCAVAGDRLAWPIASACAKRDNVPATVDGLPSQFEVAHTPFLGILVSARIAKRIGPPDTGFFLGRDDVEYCLRAKRCGAKIVLVGKSRIEHPEAESYSIRLPWRTIRAYRVAPWKRYYLVRNRLLIARKYYGWSTYYRTLPATFLRLLSIMWNQPRRLLQTRATVAGIIDGLLGRTGRRHDHWGIKP